ncbi:ATP-dependent RecD-like DNA helicase [Ligilactobacillus ceti]|uniref:ATP-dependent RecD2 DNA helicase n=1 Tax=Ligilactobacillus ceti DSM 22408 TaxID=1122146 RepID=A0A0R2KQV7_9LACO|nr:ATP-dependent RecD-like DNA helicase [Ligilactobacillus ceti]KRN88938.1 helicase, recd traa family [Ligilactobacillus ceti DSM 22408]
MVSENVDLFAENKQLTLVGEVKNIFFAATDSFYKVIQVKIHECDFNWKDEYIIVVGDLGDIQIESMYRFKGELVTHPKYNQQFKVFNYTRELPSTATGLVTYLSSDNFPGIGKKSAEKIVDRLGPDAISLILKNEYSAKELGLSKKQYTTLLQVLNDDQSNEQIIISLNNLGLTSKMAAKIYAEYEEKTLDIIHEDPYRLALEIKGFGFVRADQLAQSLGFAFDSKMRLRAGIMQVMLELTNETGNTYQDLKEVLEQSLVLLENGSTEAIDPNAVADQMIQLVQDELLFAEEKKVYLRKYYYREIAIARDLRKLFDQGPHNQFDEKELEAEINSLQDYFSVTYGEDQIEAIKMALTSSVSLITGGPGTGKTTIINGIVNAYANLKKIPIDPQKYDDEEYPILLAAPTGRAAKRMSETTGLPASTLHRLLKLNGYDNQAFDDGEFISGKLLIVDEASMIDTDLMYLLIKNLPAEIQVVFVGDRNQLPSVGPGQVFSDLLMSKVLPQKELNQIYRQSEDSTIVKLAHDIKNGVIASDLQNKYADRSFIPCHAEQIPTLMTKIIKIALQKEAPIDDIQVLAPMYRGLAGINYLNETVQKLVNPYQAKKHVEINNQNFSIGDRVLNLVNTPEKGIFNGDIGKVVGLEMSAKDPDTVVNIIVQFDELEVEFTLKEMRNLTLAYCMTIHKAQGSEFPIVILPMVSQYSRMFARNLLYTAITRAKEKLILLGEPAAYQKCVETLSLNRQTSLQERIEVFFEDLIKGESSKNSVAESQSNKTDEKQVALISDQQDKRLTVELIQQGKIDPLIGMDNLKPFDFMKKEDEDKINDLFT